MREILPGIFTWSCFSEPHGYPFNGWLVRRPEGNVIVDPVQPTDEDRAALALSAPGPTIVVTNRNHGRAANLVRQITGGRTAVHPDDQAHARTQGLVIENPLAIGQRIGPFTVVGAAGKSPGEVGLHWPERQLLVVGDALIGHPAGALGLLRPAVIDDLPRLHASVRELATLQPDVILVGDGAPILSGATSALAALIATFPA